MFALSAETVCHNRVWRGEVLALSPAVGQKGSTKAQLSAPPPQPDQMFPLTLPPPLLPPPARGEMNGR